MRDELHLMELVDRYLDGSMSADDRAAFEARAKSSAELRELIEDQRALREGVARAHVRAAATKAYRAYRFGKPGPWIGGAAVIAVIGITAVAMMLKSEALTGIGHSGALTGNTEEAAPASDDADRGSRPLVIHLDPRHDTTVLSPGGIVLDIPRGCFTDSMGRAITGPVQVTLKEALTAIDIIKAGLSTMSGDTLLETGGMFHIDARQNGRAVRIDPGNPITAMVPADGKKDGMQLYRGEELLDGRIDWRDPQPLKQSLVPVDITTLNFYPPGYEAKLAELGQDVRNKAFRDSLYYSFSTDFPLRLTESDTMTQALVESFDRIFAASDTTFRTAELLNVIDPAKVKTIWQPRFNGTNLATREFEERMRAIHGTCDNAVLDLYANNLDKDLSDIDARVGRMGHPMFDHFAKRNDGRVDLPAHAADRLRAVYENWSRAEAEAIRKAQEKFWAEQAKQDATAGQRRVQHSAQEIGRRQELFQREYDANLAETCRQLGIEKLGPRREPPITAYVANITNPGWWNIDRAVFQATADRRDMRFTDKQTGRTATLTYAPITVEVDDRASFDELFVYLIPSELNSFQRMNEQGGSFQERLNTLLTYDLLCLGMKGAQQFAFTTKASGQSRITASLAPTDDNGLRAMLRTKGNVEERLLDESRYLIWSAGDRTRQKTNAGRVQLRQALMEVVFPCSNGGVPAASITEQILGPEKTILLQNILSPDNDGVNDRLIVPGGPYRRASMFVSNSQGSVVFTSDGPDPIWDGRLTNGQPAPAGIYQIDVSAVGLDGSTYGGRERVRLVRSAF